MRSLSFLGLTKYHTPGTCTRQITKKINASESSTEKYHHIQMNLHGTMLNCNIDMNRERKYQVFFRQSSKDLSQKDKVEKTSSLSVAIGLTVTAESFLHQPLYFMPSASLRVLVPRGLLLLHSPWPSWLLHGEDWKSAWFMRTVAHALFVCTGLRTRTSCIPIMHIVKCHTWIWLISCRKGSKMKCK